VEAKGNLVPDAYLAALAIEHGCEWISADRDFARFPGLRWRHPFDCAGTRMPRRHADTPVRRSVTVLHSEPDHASGRVGVVIVDWLHAVIAGGSGGNTPTRPG
jgi:hypothetical protein